MNEGAENKLCPTDAIDRQYISAGVYDYRIDEKHCVACAKCVDGSRRYGNGEYILQIKHNLCVDCDSCSIDNACPSGAFHKIPAANGPIGPYLLKGEEHWWPIAEETWNPLKKDEQEDISS